MDPVAFVRSHLKSVAIAVAVFFLASWINPFHQYGFIPLAAAVAAFYIARFYVEGKVVQGPLAPPGPPGPSGPSSGAGDGTAKASNRENPMISPRGPER